MFVGEQCGKAEEAIRFYASVFRDAKVGDILRYGRGEEPDREGTVKYAAFTLEGQEFAAMDSAREHDFSFNEAISFMVHCDTQEEIDYYWGKLSADPEAEAVRLAEGQATASPGRSFPPRWTRCSRTRTRRRSPGDRRRSSK